MNVTALIGHEKPASRTRLVGEAVGSALAGRCGGASVEVVDLSSFLGELVTGGDAVAAARSTVRDSDVLVVASPTYKATYTGVLKVFLDGYRAGDLARCVAVPVMLAAAPHHALAGDVHLRPLLVELGAVCPTSAVFVLDGEVEHAGAQVARWADAAAPVVRGVLAARP